MKGSLVACDTSVLVSALRPDFPQHRECQAQLPRLSALIAHTLLETFRVMTSTQHPSMVDPGTVVEVLGRFDLPVLQLPPSEYLPLLARFAENGRVGGGIYDAQIAGTAQHHGLTLLSRDRRATAVYDLVGVDYELV